ncbi:MAG: TrpB-like pyridoxal phosphate-dependent enzyme, partial [Acidimicrobiia bacterium]
MADVTKVLLDESEIPTAWYNLVPDLPAPPPPPLHPGTLEPVGPDDLAPLFPPDLIAQEVTSERYVDIPGEVLDVYKLWRPTPLYRARRLEKALDTPARIYFKYEGTSPAGSHKPNTAVPQAYYNAKAGVRKLTTETGAGQWGSALALATSMFGLECEVWQVRASYDQKPYRRLMMETWGATVHPSPSNLTEAGRAILEADPDSTGSLGIAISEAVEVAAKNPDTNYSLGSVLNHVLMHQTIIGEEALIQLEKIGEQPDVLIGCTGGGSNFGGLAFPFLREKLAGRMDPVIRCVEPAACPSLTKGVYAYDFGDTAGMTPLLKMHTLGHDFVPDPIHAGGLRYHGMAPLISHVYELGLVEAEAIGQVECFERAVQFARSEGIIPAPEPTHAIASAAREAIAARESGEEKVILTALCGHGHFDMAAYDAFLRGEL